MSESKPKPLFFIVLVLAIASLIVYGLRDTIFPEGGTDGPGNVIISKDELTPDSVEADDSYLPSSLNLL